MRKIIILSFFISILHSTIGQVNRIDSLKMILSNTNDPITRYNLMSEIGSEYYTKGIGQNAVSNNLEMLRIALQQKNDSLIAISFNKVGDYYIFEQADFYSGMDYIIKGIPYAEKVNNKRILSSLYIDLSAAHYWALNPKEQLNFLNKAEANLPDSTHPDYYFVLLQLKFNFALHYLTIKQPKKALPFLNSANEVNMKLNYQIFDFYIKTAFGNLYDQEDEDDLAAVYFSKALQLDIQTHFPTPRFLFKYYYTNFLLKLNRYPEAEKQAKELLIVGEQARNNYFKFTAAGFLKNIFDNQHKVDSAFYYSKQELVLRDSIFNQERLNKIQAIAFDEEVRETEQQNKKADAEQERRRNIQYNLIAFSILVFIMVYLLLSRSFITSPKIIAFFGVVALLIVFEFLNLLLHPFLERVTHHSPILMLLALVSIASLLVPLHHKVEKWATHRLIERNKQIRLADAKKTIKELETHVSDS